MRLKLALAVAVTVAFSWPAWAHHSHGNYVDAFTDMEGTVQEVHLLLPHSWVYLKVNKGGEEQIWALEATARNGLERIGVTKDTVKPGDKITVTGATTDAVSMTATGNRNSFQECVYVKAQVQVTHAGFTSEWTDSNELTPLHVDCGWVATPPPA